MIKIETYLINKTDEIYFEDLFYGCKNLNDIKSKIEQKIKEYGKDTPIECEFSYAGECIYITNCYYVNHKKVSSALKGYKKMTYDIENHLKDLIPNSETYLKEKEKLDTINKEMYILNKLQSYSVEDKLFTKDINKLKELC